MSGLVQENGETKGNATLSSSPEKVWLLGRVPVDVDIYEREMRRGRLNSHDHALVVARAPPGFMYTPIYGLGLFTAAPIIYGRYLARRRWSPRFTVGAALFGGVTGFALGWVAEAGATFLPMMQLTDADGVREAMDTMFAEQERRQEQQADPEPILPPSVSSAILQSRADALESKGKHGEVGWYQRLKGYFGGS